MTPRFLELAEVLEIHQSRIELYGGSEGVRDLGLVQSALAQPGAGFGGEFFHKDLYEMAAAYLFHLARNHAFVDELPIDALRCLKTFRKRRTVVHMAATKRNSQPHNRYPVWSVPARETNQPLLVLFWRRNAKSTMAIANTAGNQLPHLINQIINDFTVTYLPGVK